MSDWIERTRGTIKLTSPEGNIFEALWRSNRISQGKKIGEFNYPKILGSVIQDLGVNSTRYPMILYFDGPDNDIEGQRFQAAFNESGVWTIIHPVLGEKLLQPISFSPDINPTTSGNVTVFTTEWIEPISDAVITSVQELEARIQEQQAKLNAQGASQFTQITSQIETGETVAITDESNNFLTSYDEFLDGLAQINSDIYNGVVGIKRGIDNTILQPIINTSALFGQFQQTLELPALVTNDFEARITPYIDFATDIFTGSEGIANTAIGKNTAATKEAVLSAVISTLGTIAITSDLQTRPQAIQAVEDITNLFNEITNNLDIIQKNFSDNTVNNQYFSQSQSFSEASLLIAYISAYLLRISLDLKIEKRFILKKDRTSIEITISEYGGLGENDNNLDLFIFSNNLKNRDILILPAGKEVVVYV